MADEAQETIMELRWTAWPTCPAHGLGTHAQEDAGVAVWWCRGGGGHPAAAVGQWR